MTSEDHTPTDPPEIEVDGTELAAFRKHPENGDQFLALKARFRKSGDRGQTAELFELRAPHEKDAARASAMWSDAGELRFELGDKDSGEADLKRALHLDPGNERAAARLTEHLLVARRFAEAAQVLESELAELERRADKGPTGSAAPGPS